MNKDISEIISDIRKAIRPLENSQKPILIAIDGRCSAGKTTLAAGLQKELGCCVIHMDDFFLQPQQRTPERYREPGGNVDYERFLTEVMEPLVKRESFTYHPYDCKRQAFSEAIQVESCSITIIEGSYSCHPSLWDFYTLRIFMDIGKVDQRRRIMQRNGEAAWSVFQEKWIPLEEIYFKAYGIKDRCDLCF